MRSSFPLPLARLGWWSLAFFLGAARGLADPALTLFETPRDRDAPVLAAIHGAAQEVDVVVYELSDPAVEHALIGARQAGRTVRVILNPRFPGPGNPNAAAYRELTAAGVAVHYSAAYFTYTHEKAIIVDAGFSDQEALIMTLNLQPSYLGKPDKLGLSLNFGVVDRRAEDVGTIKRLFEADWIDAGFNPVPLPPGTDLVVSPLNSRAVLVGQIQHAGKSFHFFAQELEDPQIVAAIVAAARRGVDVRGLVPSNFAFNRKSGDEVKAAGGDVRFLDKPVYEHAKAAIADGAIVYLGSINYSTNSLERNRELGILTQQADIASSMEAEFARFWAQAKAW